MFSFVKWVVNIRYCIAVCMSALNYVREINTNDLCRFSIDFRLSWVSLCRVDRQCGRLPNRMCIWMDNTYAVTIIMRRYPLRNFSICPDYSSHWPFTASLLDLTVTQTHKPVVNCTHYQKQKKNHFHSELSLLLCKAIVNIPNFSKFNFGFFKFSHILQTLAQVERRRNPDRRRQHRGLILHSTRINVRQRMQLGIAWTKQPALPLK